MDKEIADSRNEKRGSACGSLLLVFVALMVIDYSPVLNLLVDREERARTEVVGSDVPDIFPVLVVYPAPDGHLEPAIVFYNKLKPYMKSHPGSSFTVPPGQVEQLNSELSRQTMGYDGTGVGYFTMEEHGGTQFFKVEGDSFDDRSNVGWYEVRSQFVLVPRRYANYGPYLGILFGPQVVLANIVLSFVIVNLALFISSRRRRRAPTGIP